MSHEKASLLTIGGGAAVNKFDHALLEAIKNCRDPNTDTKTVRKITLEVKLLPDANREKLSVEFIAKSKLAPDAYGTDQIVLNQKGKAFISNDEQITIDGYNQDVTPMGDSQEGNGSDDA